MILIRKTKSNYEDCNGFFIHPFNVTRFIIEPTFAMPSSDVTPYASELKECDGSDVTFRVDSCSGEMISSCTLINGRCEGLPFTAPESSGAYTYYACAEGKETSIIYMVGYSSLG